jgi:hypothetical protein
MFWSHQQRQQLLTKLARKLMIRWLCTLGDVATIPVNLAGICGMSLPAGLADEDNLPVGFQIMAPAMQDQRLYQVGAALEAALTSKWGGASHNKGSRALAGGAKLMALTYDEVIAKYDPVLGLEVHVELNTHNQRCSVLAQRPSEQNLTLRPVRSAWRFRERCL